MKKIKIILGIETSCDETAAAVIEKTAAGFLTRSSIVASQIKIHQAYGGVVPEVAAREHVTAIMPTIRLALKKAKLLPAKLDAVAVTTNPGLITSLSVGVQTASTLARIWGKPLIGVNHLAGHVFANWLTAKKINLPAMCLIVSGGHTELIIVGKNHKFSKIGETLDDAAGEAFDKVAKLLNLPYPGGPQISRLAKNGNKKAFQFPRPMISSSNHNFSFSGLKTAVRYTVEKLPKISNSIKADIAASFEQAVVETLVAKTFAAAKEHHSQSVMIAGGVAANAELRKAMQLAADKENLKLYQPAPEFCTDNAAMIAGAAFFTKPEINPYLKVKINR